MTRSSYNTTRNSFPAVMTASLLGFKEEPFFQADPAAKTAPSVGDANSMRKPGGSCCSGSCTGRTAPANK